MARFIGVESYLVRIAACSRGFNEWNQNITIRTSDSSTACDLRFVDNPDDFQNIERVREGGWSQVYLASTEFSSTLHLLQSEKPLYLVLYEGSNRIILQTTQEPPGEEESSS